MINDTLPCTLSMPTTGTADNQLACTGKLFDSGGPANAYGDNESSSMTIAPTGAQTVSLSFLSFDIEPGTGSSCNYDYLNIYDGSNSNAPLIGKYCNNNIPTTITSTGGSITIVFSSDGGVTGNGFEMDWQCNIATAAPVADFSNNINSTCGPDIEFTDISSNGPTSWLWTFGDGQTSTLQHPVHHYQNSGTYDVSLTSTNSFGNSVETKVSLITVTYSGTASAISTMVCPNHPDTLIASTGGTNYWYDSQYSGASIFQGDTFITPPLTVNTMYYLEQRVATPSIFVGPADNNFGTGGNFAGDQHLIFDVASPIILSKVTMYATGSGIRNIELRGSNGAVLNTANVMLVDGPNTVSLNFEIQSGTNYELGMTAGSQPNLYRNNSGASFPYSIANKVSITGTSASAGFYYFFYNWEIKDITCSSPRIEVEAQISACLSVEENSLDYGISVYPNPTQNEFNIQLDDFKPGQNTMVSIVNATGQQVYVSEISSEQTTINASKWAKGVYLVKVTFNDKYTIERVIVE
jgi:PKD repeat protein